MRWTQIAAVLTFVILGQEEGSGPRDSVIHHIEAARTTGSGTGTSSGSPFGSNSDLSNLNSGTPTLNSANGVGGQARKSNSFVGANTGQTAQQNFVGRGPSQPSGPGQSGMLAITAQVNGMGGMGMGSFGMGALLGRRNGARGLR